MGLIDIIIIIGFLFLVINLSIYLFYRYIYIHNRSSCNEDFLTLVQILKSIIDFEISEYDRTIFINKKGLTNANFNNYYNDICTKIISRLSASYIRNFNKYMDKDFLYIMIARDVKNYLNKKILVLNDIITDGDE